MMKIRDLEIVPPLPQLRDTVAVYDLAAPMFAERRAAIERLAQELTLGELRRVELEHATVMASSRGSVECFTASGAVWARDATASGEYADERRDWPGTEPGTGDRRVVLNRKASKAFIDEARRLMEPLGLLGKGIESESVDLDQVAQLDENGKEIWYGAGQATIRFSYAMDGIPIRGAGAKTLLFADPAGESMRVSGAFHAWRIPNGARPLRLMSVERALGVGVLSDPELEFYRNAGHGIRIERLELVYLALPAFMRQDVLFPAFQIEGEVSSGKRGDSFRFARYHHAAPPEAYHEVGLFAPYLSANPDRIAARQERTRVGT